MQLSVVGCGYLGAVHAAAMASLGHDVVGLDVDARKVEMLNRGEMPFYEPGLAEVLRPQLEAGRLRFTTNPDEIAGAEIHFLAVGTPQTEGRLAADLRYVDEAVATIITHGGGTPERRAVLAGKSTVPVGTASDIAERVAEAGAHLSVVWNPEFLREGFAVKDTLHPDRIVYGLPSDPDEAAVAGALLDDCYAALLAEGTPLVKTDYATAELVKVAANSFLATKISFINAMAELCSATGADVTQLAEAIGYDDRIGPKFLRAGIGFGGGCLPKDIRAFMARAGELGVDQALTFLREVDGINSRARQHVVGLAKRLMGGRFVGHRIAVLGAAFKPNSDDLRDSPALDIAQQIWSQGAEIAIIDPAAGPALRIKRPKLNVVDTVTEAVEGADIVMLLTEWQEFIDLDPVELITHVRTPHIIDGRNVLDPARWRAAGWTYHGIGR